MGLGGKKTVKLVTNREGEEEWKVTFLMTEPVKIHMIEKAELVERLVDMLEEVKNLVGDKVTVMNMSMSEADLGITRLSACRQSSICALRSAE